MGKRVLCTFMAMGLIFLTACQPSLAQFSSSEPGRQTIVVYGFSVEEEVLVEGIFPAFQDHWRQQTGQEVVFDSIFDSSEQLTQSVLDGAPADVALLSNEQPAIWLRINDVVESDWQSFPYHGVVSHSPIAIVVRPGNPLGIENWADLARPNVRLIHPDPRTSGGAQWALLAEYGSKLLEGNNGQDAARQQLDAIWANAVETPASSREALKKFLFGVGDALVTYEQDALLAQARGADLEVIIPPSTIMTEHVVVMVDKNVKPWEREVVQAFIDFLWSDTAQQALTGYYFRSVTNETFNDAVLAFSALEGAFTVTNLGGWGYAYPEIVHDVWEEQILTDGK